MRLNKLKKIYQIIFPEKLTRIELFEKSLKSNYLIKKFVKSDFKYELDLVNGLKIILRDQNFSDYEVFKQIFNNKEYGIVVKILNLNPNLPKEKIIIDAGANVGYSSIFFYSHLGCVKIFGVEPSCANVEIFKENIKFLKEPEKIKLYNNALSDKPDINFKIDREFRDKMDWSITTKEDEDGEIKGITIDEIILENSLEYISLLKIDIEGAERFIFKKGNKLSFLQRTQIIAIEIHDEFQIREEIHKILRFNGFLIFESGETTIGLNKYLI